jgi:hypothetical protein
MNISHQTILLGTSMLLLVTGPVFSQGPNDTGQAMSLRLASPKPALIIAPATSPRKQTLTWDANAVGFVLQSTSELLDHATPWAPVSALGPIGGAASADLSGADPLGFYELKAPRGVGPRIATPPFDGRVDVPILETSDRVPATSLTVWIQPESGMVETNHPAVFMALVDGYAENDILTFTWELNTSPYTTNLVTTNSTWRDFNIGSNSNFVAVASNPNTNVFTIPSVTFADVAYYRVTVRSVGTDGTNIAVSAAAPLWVWEPTNSIIVQGTPVQLVGGSSIPCQGPFSYVVPFPGVFPDPPANSSFPVNEFDDHTLPGTSVYWSTSTGRYKDQKCGVSGIFTQAQITYASKAATVPWYFTVYIPSTDVQPPNPTQPPAQYSVYMQFH